MTSSLLPLLFALALSAEGDASPSAAARFDEARRFFDRGQYLDAARVFGELQNATGDAALLYPTAQSLRLGGRCADALTAYERFIAEGDRLRARAETASAGSGVKRLASDLVYAGARVVEMRACVAKPRVEDARQNAQQQAAGGETLAAIAKLSAVWSETRDATILPEIADLHRTRGDCKQANDLLDLATTTLSPIENLREAAAPGSDLARTVDALRRARTARAEAKCTAGVVTTAPAAAEKPAAKLALAAPAVAAEPRPEPPPGDQPPATDRPLWPLWTAAVGATLVGTGAVSLLLARSAGKEYDTYTRREGGYDTAEADKIYRKGERYNLAGIILVSGGAAATSASLIYYFVAKDRDPGTGPAVQIAQSTAIFSWAGRF